MKDFCKLASRILEIRVPYKTRGLKTRFLLAELDTFMPHRSRVFYSQFQKTQKKKVQTQKKKEPEERKKKEAEERKKKEVQTLEKERPEKEERTQKKERKKEEEDPQQRRRPTAHTNPVSIKHIPIIDLRYSS